MYTRNFKQQVLSFVVDHNIIIGITCFIIVLAISLCLKSRLGETISLIPLILFGFGVYKHWTDYDKTSHFRIVQNLWDKDKPRFSLINDSSRKLNDIPHPSYITLIPSKVYFYDPKEPQDGALSIVTLSPFSYQNIIDEEEFGETTGKIETVYLSKNFYARKGLRDYVWSKSLSFGKKLKIKVVTLPMIVILTDNLRYRYLYGIKSHKSCLLSTSLLNTNIDEHMLNDIMDYIHDNASVLEVKPQDNRSIYNTVNDNVYNVLKKASNQSSNKKSQRLFRIIGAKTGGYNFVLKLINNTITPEDPMNNYLKKRRK